MRDQIIEDVLVNGKQKEMVISDNDATEYVLVNGDQKEMIISDRCQPVRVTVASVYGSKTICAKELEANGNLTETVSVVDNLNFYVDNSEKIKEKSSNKKTTCQKSVLLTSAALCFAVVSFQTASFGAYYAVFTTYFNVSRSTAGWVGSLQNGIAHGAGRS